MNRTIALSDGEWKLMTALWTRSPQTITELVHAIKMLARLEEKGAVRHESGDRAKKFYPIADHRTAVLEETRGFLQKVYGGSIGLMMHAMVEENALSQEELDQLYTILQKAEEGSTHER